MRKLITETRWKNHLRRRQADEISRRTRTKPVYRPPKPKRTFSKIVVPSVFSMIKNPEGMNTFLQRLRTESKLHHISLALKDVKLITTEAIAALMATIKSDTTVRGDLPEDPTARQVLLASGFFEHVKSTMALPDGQLGKIKERKSKRVEPTTARELIECGTLQAFGSKKNSHSTRAAYTTLIELMGNTHNHAAGNHPEIESWWATAYGDVSRKLVCYSFLDTGVGIFRSVKVAWISRAFRRLGISRNADLLPEIFEGRVESRTGLPYRGKGLPTIYRKLRSGDLQSLFVISNDVYADVSNGEYKSLESPFPGTLFYWESEE